MKQTKKPKYLPLTLDNLVELDVIGKEKAEVIAHKAKIKTMIGAKNSGKTFVAMLDIVYKMKTDPMTHFYGFRKYKTNASAKMSEYFTAVVNAIESKFGSIGKFRATGNIIQKIKSKTDKMKNQMLKFGSLDDVSGTTDGVLPPFGYYGGVLIDECVIRKDVLSKGIPSKEDWEQDLEIITDNISRAKDVYEHNTGKKVGYTEWHTLNPWPGKHPKIVEAERILPEHTFIKYVLLYSYKELLCNVELIEREWANIKKSIETHFIMSAYDEKTDHLVTRNTKFANPTISKENRTKILHQIKRCLITGEVAQLTILLGFEALDKLDTDMLAYDLQKSNFTTKTYDDLLKEGYLPYKINYSIDVDTSRVFTIAAGVHMKKKAFFDKSEREPVIYIPPIMEIRAAGTGAYGEKNPMYVKLIAKFIDKNILQYVNKNNDIKCSLVIDDKRKWFLYELWKLHKTNKGLPFIKRMNTFLQHGTYNILARQEWFSMGVRNNTIVIDPKNAHLIDDVLNCLREDINSPKRNTKGTLNYLDRIDAVENAFIPFLPTILKGGK